MALIHIGAPTFLLLVGVFVWYFMSAMLGLLIIGVAIIAFIAVFLMGAALLGTSHHDEQVVHEY